VKWLRKLLHFPPSETDTVLDRADVVIDNVKSVRITVVPKNARALAELRRLEGHVRR
jgi:hypothetical protein